MRSDLRYARLLAQITLAQLGDEAPDWVVVDVEYFDDDVSAPSQARSSTLLISLRSSSGKYEDVGAYFLTDTPFAEATVATVGQIQEHALEATGGASLPPCPGHAHPLTPEVVAGVPKWICLKEGPEYYEREILKHFAAARTPEEYVRIAVSDGD